MIFNVEIATGNAAFGDDPNDEVARLLTTIIDKLHRGLLTGPIMDSNGNRVGTFWYEDEG